MAFCRQCGSQIGDFDAFCKNCGAVQQTNQTGTTVTNVYVNGRRIDASYRSRLIALLLCVFLGEFGIHRFYAGKIGTGIIWLFTWGCFGIGYIVDLIMIACGAFRDADGYLISDWNI